MHRILLRTVCLDFAPADHDAGLAFWQRALAAGPKRGVNYPEFHLLEHPAAVMPLYVQHIADGASRIHVDIETDDVPAEVARLCGLDATVEQRHQSDTIGDWAVLRDPAGLIFCVVTYDKDDESFERLAVAVD